MFSLNGNAKSIVIFIARQLLFCFPQLQPLHSAMDAADAADTADGPPTPSSSRPKRVRRAPAMSEYVQDGLDEPEHAAALVPPPKRSRGAGTPRGRSGGGGGGGFSAAAAAAAAGSSPSPASGGGGGGCGSSGAPSPIPWDPCVNGIIPGGSMSADGEAVFFALNSGYYAEIERRAGMIVAANIGVTWGGTAQCKGKADCDMEAAIEDAARMQWRGLLRRKNAYVWQTRLMIERTSLNAGHFDHPLLAAVAYDFSQSFLRPSLRNANGTTIALNFHQTASDTRLVPVTPAQGLTVICLERPGVAMEEGHFWRKDDEYYAGAQCCLLLPFYPPFSASPIGINNLHKNSHTNHTILVCLYKRFAEIKERALALERSGCVPASASGSELAFVGIQRHKRKQAPGVPAAAETGSTFTWEGKLIYRRKWFYLGRFKTQLEAAVA